MQKTRTTNTALLMAIALALASKRLQRHTGVCAADWRLELLGQAVEKFNEWTPAQLQKFMRANYGEGT